MLQNTIWRACFALVLFLVSLTSQADVEEMESLLSQQMYNEAYNLGVKEFDLYAGEPDFDFLFGIAAQRAGHPDQAIFAFERVLLIRPRMQVAKYELARSYFILDNYQTARRYFNELLAIKNQLPAEAVTRINWHLTVMDARESGKAVASSEAVTNYFVGANFGFDSNPLTTSHSSNPFKGTFLEVLNYSGFKVDASSFHEVYAGATRFQQQGKNWGWFVGGRAGLEGFHVKEVQDSDNFSIGAQAGFILLGQDWHLSLPLQFNYLKRDDKDKNTVNVYALGASFNKRLGSDLDYTLMGQLAKVSFDPVPERNAINVNLSAVLNYHIDEQIKVYAGPVFTYEDSDLAHLSYLGYGLKAGAGYSLTDKQYFDLSLNYNITNYDEEIEWLFAKRNYKRVGLDVKYNQRFSNKILFTLGLEQTVNSADLDLYDYRRTRVSAGLRKEW